MHLRKETCYECEKHLRYMESSPAKQMGVTMHMGEHFCTGGKRARKFKRNDPKIYVPSWCPKRKLGSYAAGRRMRSFSKSNTGAFSSGVPGMSLRV